MSDLNCCRRWSTGLLTILAVTGWFAASLAYAQPSATQTAADHGSIATPLLLVPDAVFTAEGERRHAGWAVLVEGERITAVGEVSALPRPAGVRVIALPGTTLLPGLMDLHVHLFLHPYNEALWNDQVLKEPVAYRAIAASRFAEANLRSGFTFMRDLGSEGAGYADVALKQAIDDGLIPGPRLQIATLAIAARGCYGPGPKGFREDLESPKGAQMVSGVDEIVRAVREQAGHGADWIKVYADHRCGPGGAVVPAFSQDELNQLVRVARDLGRKVAAHAAGAEGMRRAALAGVDSIEHGYGGTREVFELMAERGVAYFPTLAANAAYAEYFEGYKPGKSEPTAGMEQARQALQLALQADVTIGLGSDVGVFPHGEVWREAQWLREYGMSPADIAQAATRVNAEVAGVSHELGLLRAGYLADLVAVQGNPLEDATALSRVVMVVKAGVIVRDTH